MQTIDLRELEHLRQFKLNIRKSLSLGEGARRSSAKGRSAEFSGYREYIPGDDMRYVDWNAYARLDKLFIKEYMEEKEGRVNIYLDTSRSMEFGRRLKSTAMAELTEAISFIAANGRDAVYVTDLQKPLQSYRVPSGPGAVPFLKKWLENIEPQGSINLSEALPLSIRTRGGTGFILSDFMDDCFEEAQENIIRLFKQCGMQAFFIQILSEEELDIDDSGNYQFIDSENESRDVRVTLDRRTINSYKAALDEYINKIKMKASVSGEHYILCSTGDPLQMTIYEILKMT